MKYYSYKEEIVHKTENFPVAYYCVDRRHPRYEMIHHWHNEYELIHIISGDFLLTLDRSEYKLTKDNFALIESGVVHSGTPQNCVYECVVFSADIINFKDFRDKTLEKLFLHKLTYNPIFSRNHENTFKAMTDLCFAMREKNIGFEPMALSAIYAMFYSLISDELIFEAPSSSKREVRKLIPLENAVTYIEEHYSEKITLEELANVAGVSRKYLGDYFRKITGKTPFEYLNDYRIERACDMLTLTNIQVTEIALDCGFKDLSYFIKTFRSKRGITPKKYRSSYVEK